MTKFIPDTSHTIRADELRASDVGARIRVPVLGGAVVEDQLNGFTVDSPGKVRIWLSFREVMAATSPPTGVAPPFAFPVMPAWPVEILQPAGASK